MELEECGYWKKGRYIDRKNGKEEKILREYYDDGFRVINSDALNYVNENKNLDFIELVNLVDVGKYLDKDI